jgi:glycosyltransferase involved in cell wall biosynthesis
MFGIKGIPLPAGAEVVAEELGSRLVKRGHEVIAYVRPHYTPKTLKEYRGIRLIHLPSVPTKNLDAITHSFLCSIAVLFEKPDVVHIHSTGNSIYALWLRVFGLKVLVQSHGLDWQRAKWGKIAKAYLKFTDFSTVNFPNAISAVSIKMKHYYENRFKREVVYIPNGVNICRHVEPNEILKFGLKGNDYIFFAARLVPEKGAHYLIKAFQMIENRSMRLVIAGDGPINDKYVQSIKQFANDRIIFPGFVQGKLLQEFLSNAIVYVLPSEIEGLSTGLLEAMGYGNCVLVSNIEENLEAIGDAGFAFENKNVMDLKDKLNFLLNNQDIVVRMRKLAKESVNHRYNWETITDQFEDLYQKIVSAKTIL